MAMQCGLGETAEAIIAEVLAATPQVVESVQKQTPKGFPQRVLDAILKGLLDSAKRLRAMPAV